MAKFNAYLLPTSESEKKRALDELGFKNSKILEIYPNSIKIDSSVNKTKNDNIIRILTLARMTYQKNPEMYINIAKSVLELYENVEFFMVGEGYADELSNKVHFLINKYELKNKIRVLPWLPEDKIKDLLEEAHIYVSTSRFEGLPTIILLAMNKCLPICATNVDGNKDCIIDGETGYLCEIEEEMIIKISELVINADLRRRFGGAGKALLKNKFDIEKNIKKLETNYFLLSKIRKYS